MPIYTLNLFDIVPSEISIYRQYSRDAGKEIQSLGGKVICGGWHPTTLHGEVLRNYLIVVEFPDLDALNIFLYDPSNAAMHILREISTENYIWKIFEPWDIKQWVAFPSMK